jgi:ribosome-binding factor A
MKQYPRQRRVALEMQRALAMLIRPLISTAQISRLTLSTVEVSPDYRRASVLLTYLGEADELALAVRTLNQAAPQLRYALGQQLRLRSVPELRFHADTHLAQSMRMGALLTQIAGEHPKES